VVELVCSHCGRGESREKVRVVCSACAAKLSAQAQATTANSAMVQLLCNVKGLLLNHDTPPREARADVIRAINAVLAQQHQ